MFTTREKSRLRDHLGYPNVGEVATFSLGVPQAFETTYMIEDAFTRVLPEAEETAREILAVLESMMADIVDSFDTLAAEKVGDITLNMKQMEMKWGQYDLQRARLGNLFGVVPNPFDQRFGGGGRGGINVSVRH